MSLLILISLLVGTVCGYTGLFANISSFFPLLTKGALTLLFFTVGFDFARSGNIKKQIKEMPRIGLAIPFVVGCATLFFAFVVGPLLDLLPGDALLISAGFGWYSLSAVLVAETYNVTTGALTLLTNVFREVLALLLIPLIARRLGFLPSIAPGGATTLNVTLPVISRSTNPQTVLVAMYSGAILSGVVPFIVPLIIQILRRLQ